MMTHFFIGKVFFMWVCFFMWRLLVNTFGLGKIFSLAYILIMLEIKEPAIMYLRWEKNHKTLLLLLIKWFLKNSLLYCFKDKVYNWASMLVWKFKKSCLLMQTWWRTLLYWKQQKNYYNFTLFIPVWFTYIKYMVPCLFCYSSIQQIIRWFCSLISL